MTQDKMQGIPREYAGIIDLPHHVSSRHPQMSMADRAAQFSPFAALTGYDDEVAETARLTESRIELDPAEIELLDGKLADILAHPEDHPRVRFTYFVPDEKKEGGAHVTATGAVKKADALEKIIVLTDGTRIPIEDVVSIEDDEA